MRGGGSQRTHFFDAAHETVQPMPKMQRQAIKAKYDPKIRTTVAVYRLLTSITVRADAEDETPGQGDSPVANDRRTNSASSSAKTASFRAMGMFAC